MSSVKMLLHAPAARNADVTGRGARARGPTMMRREEEGAYKPRDPQSKITRGAARSRCRGRGAHPYRAVARPHVGAPAAAAETVASWAICWFGRLEQLGPGRYLLAFQAGPPARGGWFGYRAVFLFFLFFIFVFYKNIFSCSKFT